MHNLIERGFPGEIYPINPKHEKIWGKSACPSIGNLKNTVDLAILATPILSAFQIVKECAAAWVGGVVTISAGGKEIGEEGKKVEAAIRKEAETSGRSGSSLTNRCDGRRGSGLKILCTRLFFWKH
jgi:acetyltransferase